MRKRFRVWAAGLLLASLALPMTPSWAQDVQSRQIKLAFLPTADHPIGLGAKRLQGTRPELTARPGARGGSKAVSGGTGTHPADALDFARLQGRTWMHDEPIMDVAHLGHLELLTPTPEASLRFFVDVMGMTESGRQGDSVYLRAWDDYERYSLQLTAAKTSGLGHASFRVRSPQALQRRVAALESTGRGVGWHEEGLGHGPAYRFHDPDGHLFEIYYETEWYEAPPELRPALKNQAQRYPARGVSVRRLDHFNCLAVDVRACREFFERYLGFRSTERIVLDTGEEAGMWLTATNKSYDFAFTKEAHGVGGRFHHITYALDSREAILQAADIFLENGVFIETGPHKHAVQQTFFLYVYEPGGNRVEVANAGARLVLAPDWKPIIWTEEERKKGQAWGLKTIESFHTHGTPPLPHQPGDEMVAGVDDLSEKGIAS